MKTIAIYSMPGCTACDQAAALLDSKGIPYKKVDIYDDQTAMDNMRAAGLRSVPQIFLEDGSTLVHLFDYNGLKKLTEDQLEIFKNR